MPGVEWIALDEPGEVVRPCPITIDADRHWKLARAARNENWGTFVLKMPHGRVFRHDGTIVTPDGFLLGDVSREPGRPPHQHSAFDMLRLPPVKKLTGRLAVLAVCGGEVYFHWMMDCLPRLDLLRRAGFDWDGIDAIVVNSFDKPFQKETLAVLGIPEGKVLPARYEMHLRADSLLVPSLAGTSGNMLDQNVEFLRRHFLPAENTGASQSPRRIYVSREDASYRHVTNESQVERRLAEHGFEPVATSRLSVREQARLFSRAEAIVAAHGAGLANLAFCSPGTKVFELFSPRYVNACYYALSHRVDANYYYLVGEGVSPPEGIDPHDIPADITVDIGKLGRLLELGLAAPSRREEAALVRQNTK